MLLRVMWKASVKPLIIRPLCRLCNTISTPWLASNLLIAKACCPTDHCPQVPAANRPPVSHWEGRKFSLGFGPWESPRVVSSPCRPAFVSRRTQPRHRTGRSCRPKAATFSSKTSFQDRFEVGDLQVDGRRVTGWEDHGDGGHRACRIRDRSQHAAVEHRVLHQARQHRGLKNRSSRSDFFELQSECLPKRDRGSHELLQSEQTGLILHGAFTPTIRKCLPLLSDRRPLPTDRNQALLDRYSTIHVQTSCPVKNILRCAAWDIARPAVSDKITSQSVSLTLEESVSQTLD